MYKNHLSAKAALEFVREKRPIICPNTGFIRQLEEFDKICNSQLGDDKHVNSKCVIA